MLTPVSRPRRNKAVSEYLPPHLHGDLERYFGTHLLELVLAVISDGQLRQDIKSEVRYHKLCTDREAILQRDTSPGILCYGRAPDSSIELCL